MRINDDIVDQLLQDWKRERPDLDASAMAVVGRVLLLGRLLETEVNNSLKSIGISYTELDVLATLRRSGRPFRLSPTALRKSALLTSGAMTACLNRLEARGLITRSSDESDRRSLTAELTSKGVKLVDKAIVVRFIQAERAVTVLSSNEKNELARLLKEMHASMK